MSLFDPARPTVTLAQLQSRIGTETGVSRWFEITQARIDAFADITEDRQFIHVDPVAAKATPFGGAIAHGFLTLSMLSAIAYDALPRVEGLAMGVNYGFDKLRFVSPVPAGARIRGRFKLEALTRRSPAEVQAVNAVTVEIEGAAKPALVAQWLSLYVLTPEAASKREEAVQPRG
jgi:acyl dehydratase